MHKLSFSPILVECFNCDSMMCLCAEFDCNICQQPVQPKAVCKQATTCVLASETDLKEGS